MSHFWVITAHIACRSCESVFFPSPLSLMILFLLVSQLETTLFPVKLLCFDKRQASEPWEKCLKLGVVNQSDISLMSDMSRV